MFSNKKGIFLPVVTCFCCFLKFLINAVLVVSGLMYKMWSFFSNRELHIILNRRKLELCEHSIFSFVDEIVFYQLNN